MSDYSHLLIKQYKYWGVYVHESQQYLGRCVVWCDRKDALHLTDATPEEYEELLHILQELKVALERSFQPDWFNFSFLGNWTRHLHCHVVPRYASNREFAGMTFKDEYWGKNFQTDKNIVTPPKILEKVKLEIQKYLNHENS